MIELKPVKRLNAVVNVPGSKSLTQRALIAAALAEGESTLIGPLASEDTAFTIGALRLMGINVDDSDSEQWQVQGTAGLISEPTEDIFLGNNGTATRFLTSVAALAHGQVHITGGDRMAERPIGPLMQALQGWGVRIWSEAGNDCPPLILAADGLSGGRTILPEGKSSQYLSSLLLVAPYTGIPQGCYQGTEYRIEGDASGASYFWAAAAVTGGRVTVANVPVPSLQGDAQLVPLLARMGCQVSLKNGGITVQGPEQLQAIEVDMGNMPDVAPTLAVVAAFAQGTTVINNIAHLRIKECDRLSAMVTELRRIGADIEEEDDRMIIHGQADGTHLHGAEIKTYEDHRIAMCFAVAGLKVSGVRITGEQCVVKSFPDFWQRFQAML